MLVLALKKRKRKVSSCQSCLFAFDLFLIVCGHWLEPVCFSCTIEVFALQVYVLIGIPSLILCWGLSSVFYS